MVTTIGEMIHRNCQQITVTWSLRVLEDHDTGLWLYYLRLPCRSVVGKVKVYGESLAGCDVSTMVAYAARAACKDSLRGKYRRTVVARLLRAGVDHGMGIIARELSADCRSVVGMARGSSDARSACCASAREHPCLSATMSFMQNDTQEQPKRSLKSNFLYQASYQVLLILVPLVTTPYLSRVLGAEGVGIFSYTYAVTSYFVMVAMLGMSTYGVREIAAAGDDRKLRSRTFCSAYALQLIVSIIVAAAYCLYAVFIDSPGGLVVVLVWGFWVISAACDISWVLFGVEEFKIPTLVNMATKLATLIIIFGFVNGPEDVWLYCLAISVSLFLNQVLIWPLLRKYVDLIRPSWAEIMHHLKPNLVLFIPVAAISLYTSMDKLLLGTMAGMEQTGFFDYSEKLSKMPMAVITAMGTVMLPRMTASLAGGRRDDALNLLENSVWAMMIMALALMFGIIAIAPEFAPVFLGEEFASCDVIMMVLAVVIPMISMTNVIGRQWLIPMQKDKYYTISVCVGAMVNIAVNLVLIPLFGAFGAAVATVAAELAVLIVQAFFARGELPFGRYALNAAPYVAIGVIMLVIVRVAASVFDGLWGLSVQGLVLEILIGIITFTVFTIAWMAITHDTRVIVVLDNTRGRR